jgi:hypothetical protein
MAFLQGLRTTSKGKDYELMYLFALTAKLPELCVWTIVPKTPIDQVLASPRIDMNDASLHVVQLQPRWFYLNLRSGQFLR